MGYRFDFIHRFDDGESASSANSGHQPMMIWVRVGVILACIVVALGLLSPPIKAKALFVCLKIHVLSYVESLGLLNRKL